MKTFAVLFLLLIAAVLQLAAQTPAPTPVDNDVVKISTSLIQVDVSVTNSKGNVVTDLKPNEIEIFENGKKQAITNFSFVGDPALKAARNVAANKLEAQLPPPPALRPENVRRAIALVVDDLTLSFQSTYYVRRALKKFVDEQMQDGDLIAIIRSRAGMGALQQFTSDKRQLYAAIERVRWSPNRPIVGSLEPFAPSETGLTPGSRADERANELDSTDLRNNIFVAGTLEAVNYVVSGMADLPGRKSVMLLSDGIPIWKVAYSPQVKSLLDLANRSAVVINTLDTRGLVVLGMSSVEEAWNKQRRPYDNLSSLTKNLEETQQGLAFLAERTGGVAIENSNDLSKGIRKILDNQSYYLIGYQPDSDTFDPATRRFNKLVVKVTRPGLTVRYRSGFFGVTDEKVAKQTGTGAERFQRALTSPFGVNDVSVRLSALFNSDAKVGSHIRSLLHVRAEDLTFKDEPDGSKTAVFDVIAAGFGDNGVPLDQIGKTYTFTVQKARYEQILRDGFVYEFTLPVKKAGAYQLRVALRDHVTEKIGSANQFIEVPDLKKKRLTSSGVYLENYTLDEWNAQSGSVMAPDSSQLADTSRRQFKRGSVLSYGFSIFNAKLNSNRSPALTMQVRVYCDGKLVLDGEPRPISLEGQSDMQRIGAGGSLNLGGGLSAGDYVMQIIVKDLAGKGNNAISSQFVEFEVVE